MADDTYTHAPGPLYTHSWRLPHTCCTVYGWVKSRSKETSPRGLVSACIYLCLHVPVWRDIHCLWICLNKEDCIWIRDNSCLTLLTEKAGRDMQYGTYNVLQMHTDTKQSHTSKAYLAWQQKEKVTANLSVTYEEFIIIFNQKLLSIDWRYPFICIWK